MSPPVEGNRDNFKWGIAVDTSINNSCSTPYRSFNYKGVDYSLYDCIYLYREGEKETDIGKLVKIWKTIKGGKRGKVVWFFRPSDVYSYLQDYDPSWNELFLASGQGKGVTNVIPLEAIAGKCNVVCTSEDLRNTRPSVSDLRKANYFFSHTFNVEDLKISDKFPDTIDMMKVERLLNFNRAKPKANGECRIGLAACEPVKDEPTRIAEKSINVQIPSSYENFEHCNPDKPKANGEHKIGLAAGVKLEDIESSTHSSEKPLKREFPSENIEHCNRYDVIAKGEGKNCYTSGARLEDVENSIHKFERPVKVEVPSTCEEFEHCASKPQPIKKRKILTVTEADSLSSPQDIQRWFSYLPWEERLKDAYEYGALIHLFNLDPSYTSSDVQNIISSAFKLKSYAKTIPRGYFYNPLYGEALIIFKSKNDADFVVNELRQKCLVDGKGRPLIARKSALNDPSRTCNFPGHNITDNLLKLKSQKRKEAAYNSHCAQANTVEYEMATQWRQLQQRSFLWWEVLREVQARDISECSIKNL